MVSDANSGGMLTNLGGMQQSRQWGNHGKGSEVAIPGEEITFVATEVVFGNPRQ